MTGGGAFHAAPAHPMSDPLLSEIGKFVAAWGRAPTPAEIYEMTDFRQAGPIARQCAALSAVGQLLILARVK